jgi:hypothetical protein
VFAEMLLRAWCTGSHSANGARQEGGHGKGVSAASL